MKSIYYANAIISVPDAIDQKIIVNGRTWRFDFDERFGPYWLRKDGEGRKCQNPNKFVWNAFMKWQKSYKRRQKANITF